VLSEAADDGDARTSHGTRLAAQEVDDLEAADALEIPGIRCDQRHSMSECSRRNQGVENARR
jgi:hypothetical protein